METTKNELSPYASIFFSKLSNYLDTKLYYFGSVQRQDYFESSDIDVAIFSENLDSTLNKMQNYLNLKRDKFKKFVWRLNANNKVVSGYKLMIKNPEHKFVAEFSIFDEKYKEDILYAYNEKKDLPFYATIMLIIIKFLYYTLGIISKEIYIPTKKYILTYVIGKPEDNFVVIDLKDK